MRFVKVEALSIKDLVEQQSLSLSLSLSRPRDSCLLNTPLELLIVHFAT
jgi:hypothetical protein